MSKDTDNTEVNVRFQDARAPSYAINDDDDYIESRYLNGERRWRVAHKYFSPSTKEHYELWVDEDGDIKIIDFNSAIKRFEALGYKF